MTLLTLIVAADGLSNQPYIYFEGDSANPEDGRRVFNEASKAIETHEH
jgi:hypothetical protein